MDDVLELEELGIVQDVDGKSALLRDFQQERAEHRGFLGGGVAEPGLEGGTVLDHRHDGVPVELGEQLEEHRDMGALLQHAIGLVAARPPPEYAADRVCGIRGYPREFERFRIAAAEMRGLVDEIDRQLGGDRVEIVTGRMALLRQLGIVVAETHDQLIAIDRLFVPGPPVAEDSLQGGDVGAVPVGWRQQIGGVRLQADQHHVAVGIEEAGKHGAAVEIDQFGRPLLFRFDLVACADRKNAPVAYQNGLGAWKGVIDGDDRTTGEDLVAGALCPGLRAEEVARCDARRQGSRAGAFQERAPAHTNASEYRTSHFTGHAHGDPPWRMGACIRPDTNDCMCRLGDKIRPRRFRSERRVPVRVGNQWAPP